MKKIFFVTLALISISALGGCSKGYEGTMNAGGLHVVLRTDRYPLVKGDNQMAVIIIGPGRRTITDAKVEAAFYKADPSPATPMNSKIEAVLNGDKYFFTVTPALKGTWKLDLTVLEPKKQAVTATFTIDVR